MLGIEMRYNEFHKALYSTLDRSSHMHDLHVSIDLLANMDYYSDGCRMSDVHTIRFVRMRRVGIVKTYQVSVKIDCKAQGFHKAMRRDEDKLKEKYLPKSYRNCIKCKLHNLRQVSISVHICRTRFDDLALHCWMKEDLTTRIQVSFRVDIQYATCHVHSLIKLSPLHRGFSVST